jgi:hypothetical protein
MAEVIYGAAFSAIMKQFAGAVMRKAFAIFILLTSCAAAQMVEGNIINSITNAGIPRAAVHLEPASGTDSENTPFDTVTDALGHFAFAQIRPGTYQFSWFSSPYIATEAPPLIHVTVGGEALKLTGRMTAMPGISGPFVDGNRDGIAGTRVRIDGPSVKGGWGHHRCFREVRSAPAAGQLQHLDHTSGWHQAAAGARERSGTSVDDCLLSGRDGAGGCFENRDPSRRPDCGN